MYLLLNRHKFKYDVFSFLGIFILILRYVTLKTIENKAVNVLNKSHATST